MIIYKAVNNINNKIYIGQTVNTLEYRKNQHYRETKSIKRKNTYFHNAIAKYGFENFTFIEIDSASSLDELNKKEQYWINYYNSTNKDIGYNLDSGGKNCFKSEITKRKIGKTTINKWSNPETARKMRNGLIKATETWIKQCENERVNFICPICGKSLTLPKWEAEKRKTCSLSCGGKTLKQIAHMKELSKIKHQQNIETKKELGDKILQWCQQNKDLIINCPYNKITTTLRPMLDAFNINDIRGIFICFNVNGRKELLKYLQDYLIDENIC